MKFGKSLEDYFWINDFKHNMIMHPFRPDLEGSNLYDYTDPEGVFLFRDFVSVSRRDGCGYVTFMWQYYNDESRFENKISHVASFPPWGWIVGTGIYLNDLQKNVNILIAQLLIVFLL